jgi:hypothetical protein
MTATTTRKTSAYRLEVQPREGFSNDTLLTILKDDLLLPLAGSGLGANNSLSILFRAASDDVANQAHRELLHASGFMIAATVLSTGQGVHYREL